MMSRATMPWPKMPWPNAGGLKSRSGTVGCALAAALLISGCTYSHSEPGLFGTGDQGVDPVPTPVVASSVLPRTGAGTDPSSASTTDLPVLGERTWISGEGLALPFRIALHAVRRFDGGTALDWSVTALPDAAHPLGSTLPGSADLALNRFDEGNINIVLLDVAGRRAYRPLTATGRESLQHCLCTPVWIAERQLRVGQTTMLQTDFPALPADLSRVDVDVTTVAAFSAVPVTPRGAVPTGGAKVDLARPVEQPTSRTIWTEPFAYPAPPGQRLQIGVDQVLVGPDLTSLTWTVRTLTPGTAINSILEPPLVAPARTSRYDFADGYASGPRIVAVDGRARTPLAAYGMTTKLNGLGRIECLCTDMRLWTTGLQDAGGRASVVTNLPALTAKTGGTVDISFPGLPTLHDVPVTRAPTPTARAVPTPPRTWTYRSVDPPAGWPVGEWPSPLPNPRQLSGYAGTVDRLS